MPKEEWGVKRVCPTTGKRFYDLNKSPIISPYTGEVVSLDLTGRKGPAANAAPAAAIKEKRGKATDASDEDEDLLVTDDDDVEIDDDLLEDEDDDSVALDDLADVAGDNDEN
jgi:uncharacterized protein (TIGR02300 family)